jgi:hypothetical protein
MDTIELHFTIPSREYGQFLKWTFEHTPSALGDFAHEAAMFIGSITNLSADDANRFRAQWPQYIRVQKMLLAGVDQ